MSLMGCMRDVGCVVGAMHSDGVVGVTRSFGFNGLRFETPVPWQSQNRTNYTTIAEFMAMEYGSNR